MNRKRIYLDHSATTPLHPSILEAMAPCFTQGFGNASSAHFFGEEARKLLNRARETVAGCICCRPDEVIFTSGGSESDNLILKGSGYAQAKTGKGKHIITSTIEHHAISHSCEMLERDGFSVTYLPVGSDGIINPDDVKNALRDDTIIVSIMYANNEVGTVQPISEISSVIRSNNPDIIFHTDAVQAAGHLTLNVEKLGVNALSLSAHKFYGPKGVGIMYLRNGTPLEPQIVGGGHEQNRRAGTENIPGIIGLANALARVENLREEENGRMTYLRDHMISRVLSEISDCQVNGHLTNRLPGNANFSFRGVDGESILLALSLNGIAVSTGSACNSGEPSFVLKAMGVDNAYINGSIRFTLGESNTLGDIDFTVDVLKQAVTRLRNMSPFG